MLFVLIFSYCKYGVACKFHHQPLPTGPMFNGQPNPNGMYGVGRPGSPSNGGGGSGPGGNQSLAGLLALGLKASMMSNDHLIANHAALLAASMNPGSQMNANRMNNGVVPPPLDPALASLLSAYLQQQQPVHASNNPNASLAALLSQMQSQNQLGNGPHGLGVGNNGNGNLSPTQLNGFDSNAAGFTQDFQAFLQHQQQQQAAFNNAVFSPAASAFNAIPNLNSPSTNNNSTNSNNNSNSPSSSSGSSSSSSNNNNSTSSSSSNPNVPASPSASPVNSNNQTTPGSPNQSTNNAAANNNTSSPAAFRGNNNTSKFDSESGAAATSTNADANNASPSDNPTTDGNVIGSNLNGGSFPFLY